MLLMKAPRLVWFLLIIISVYFNLTIIDFERWLIGFGEELEKMTDYQQLRVSRITTPSKICGGQKCLLINTKRCPVVFGRYFVCLFSIIIKT